MLVEDVVAALDDMAQEARELCYDPIVPRIDGTAMTPLAFQREYVAMNKPVILTGLTGHWPAMHKWQDDAYLEEKLKDVTVTVDWTPTGHGDCIVENENGEAVFVKPCEEPMRFGDFLKQRNDASRGVAYVQHQNSSFTEEFLPLHGDVDRDIPLARESFGVEPDAVNFWMGGEDAVSSLHKDPYENFYAVVRGTKVFTLMPPTEQHQLGYGDYPCATYVRTTANEEGRHHHHHHHHHHGFRIAMDVPPSTVQWARVDPDVLAVHPPLHAVVGPGDVLYLPAMWFHKVAQRGETTIAVNWWFDMRFNAQFAYFRLVESLRKKLAATSTTNSTSSSSSTSDHVPAEENTA